MPGKILLTVDVPGLPPSVNHMYRNAGHRRRYKTKDARDWQAAAIALMAQAWNGKKTYTNSVELELHLFRHDRHPYDADNRIKAAQDCLERAGIIKNDVQVQAVRAVKHLDRDRPSYTKITLRTFRG